MINCLINSNGKPLTDDTRNLLWRKAQEMARAKQNRMKVKTDFCAGVITTDWEHGSMGSITGLKFQADVVVETGETTITYLVRSFELEDLEWGGMNSLDEIEKLDKRLQKQSSKSHSRLN
jgi:hypothetical protein